MELILTHIDAAYVINHFQNNISLTSYIMSYKVSDDANIIIFDGKILNGSKTTLKKQLFVNTTSLSMEVSLGCRNMSLQHLVITFNVTKLLIISPTVPLGFRKNTRPREKEMMIPFSARIELMISPTYVLKLTSPPTLFNDKTFISCIANHGAM